MLCARCGCVSYVARVFFLRVFRLATRTTTTVHRVLNPSNVARVRPTAATNQLGAQLNPVGYIVLQRHTMLFARPAQLDAVHLAAVRIHDQRQFLFFRPTAVQWFEQRTDELRVETIDADRHQTVFDVQRLDFVPNRLGSFGESIAVGNMLLVLKFN